MGQAAERSCVPDSVRVDSQFFDAASDLVPLVQRSATSSDASCGGRGFRPAPSATFRAGVAGRHGPGSRRPSQMPMAAVL